MTDSCLPDLWKLLWKQRLSIAEIEALVPIVHRYHVALLPILDAVLVRLYAIHTTTEEERRIDRLVIALFDNVTQPTNM